MILLKSSPDCLQIVAKAIIEHKVVIIPTDTVYGFSGIVPYSEPSIRAIKGRDDTKPFIRLIARPSDIKYYSDTEIPPRVLQHMPGPLTVIVKNKISDTTTAFRCPEDEWLQKLILLCNAPLYTTSTNRSGESILFDVHEMEKEFSNEVFCIVDDEMPVSSDIKPSTIVDISNGDIKIIRQGSLYI